MAKPKILKTKAKNLQQIIGTEKKNEKRRPKANPNFKPQPIASVRG